MSEAADPFAGMSHQRLALAVRGMQEQLQEAEARRTEPIAVIGMSCRFPGAAETAAYWDLLRDGVDAIGEVPADRRWDKRKYYDPDPDSPGRMYTWEGGFLEGIDQFDPQFFGISPREAMRMDPQQKLLLEAVWEALEDAGQASDRLEGSPTGVYVGISTNDFLQIGCRLSGARQIDPYSGTGAASSIAAGRLSYILGCRVLTSRSTRPARRHWSLSIWRARVSAMANPRWPSQRPSMSCCRRRPPSTSAKCARWHLTGGARRSTHPPTDMHGAKVWRRSS
jgi:hypothetical protein